MFTGSIKHGAKLNGVDIRVSTVNNVADSILFSGFPHSLNHNEQNLNKYINNLQTFNKVRTLGSAALSLAYVASGRGEVYTEDSIKIWDVCAGLAIVQAAGGNFKYTGIETMNVYASNGLF
jgi:myo-inositol-1(or 4)-monophosphatase